MDTIIFKGTGFVVVDIHNDLPRGEFYPYNVKMRCGRFVRGVSQYVTTPDRAIFRAYLHHTGGGKPDKNGIVPPPKAKGFRAPLATASYCVADPRILPGNVGVDTSVGRGWPGIPYHLYFNFEPPVHAQEKLPVVYSCWPKDEETWHTKGHSVHGYGMALQGSFHIRPGKAGEPGHPSAAQMELLDAAWEEYVKPMCRITDREIYGHADEGKLSCPGGTAYEWVKRKRAMRASPAVELGS